MSQVTFTVYTVPQPQGSIRAFVNKVTGTARLTTTNKHLHAYRGDLTMIARRTLADENLQEPMAPKQYPVEMILEFTLPRPKTCPKWRWWPTVTPDLDKLARGVFDSFTGVLYADDAQVVRVSMEKIYGPIPQVRVSARTMTERPEGI